MLKESQKAATGMRKMKRPVTFIIGKMSAKMYSCNVRVGGCVFYFSAEFSFPHLHREVKGHGQTL